MANLSYRNASGLSDPTAWAALSNVKREQDEDDRRVKQFIRALLTLADHSNYDVLCRIELRDRKTGRCYR